MGSGAVPTPAPAEPGGPSSTGSAQPPASDQRGEAAGPAGGESATGPRPAPVAADRIGGQPGSQKAPAYFSEMPEPFEPRANHWLLVPLPQIFGSDELSVLSPGIAELMPRPFLAMNPEDAERLGVQEGDERQLTLGGRPREVVVRVLSALPLGVAGLPANLPGLRGIALPIWSRLI
jgi:anaerobic selenocysteine-containing dehydrogenase